jgi:hypothetical protein
MNPAGFPHSGICGSQPICGSPQLIAAYHALHRLLTPRHPPCALSSLTEHLVLDVSPITRHPVFSFQRSRKTREAAMRPRGAKIVYVLFEGRSRRPISSGGDSRDRTGNLRLAKPALSQLSYIP